MTELGPCFSLSSLVPCVIQLLLMRVWNVMHVVGPLSDLDTTVLGSGIPSHAVQDRWAASTLASATLGMPA